MAFDAENKTFEDILPNCRQSDNVTLSCKDIVWGVLTLSFIQLPGVCFAMFLAFQALLSIHLYKF